MYKKGDFHIHTTFSDGHHSPEEVVYLASKNYVDIISVTDHNCTDGIEDAIVVGKNSGVEIIPGVEVSTRFKNERVHILGYFKDDSYKNELLVEILRYIRRKEIYKIKNIFKSDINFNWKGDKLPVEVGIEILRFFGAIVVLAHPVLLSLSTLNKVIDMRFDGIEAKYFLNTKEDTENYLKIANKKKIVYTAGSDFHGLKELYRVHGMIGSVFLDEIEIKEFLNKLFNTN